MTKEEIKEVTDELYKAWHPLNPHMPTDVSILQATWESAYQLAVISEKLEFIADSVRPMTNREEAIKRVAGASGLSVAGIERRIERPANWPTTIYAVDTTEKLLAAEARARELEAVLTRIKKRFDDADEGSLHVRDGVAWAMASDARAALQPKGE